jgi:hypothetical protein
MAAPVALPAPVERKLAILARQVSFARAVRGLGLLLAVLALTFTVVFAVDFWLELTDEVLAWALTGAVVLAGLAGWFGLIQPLLRRPDYDALAAVIECRHPELAERLTSSIGLARGSYPHGTATFIGKLLEETADQTQPLPFRRALSFSSAYLLLGTGVSCLLLLAVPALAWPEHFVDFSQRFVLSWVAPPALHLEVEPGDSAAARGRPLAITARVLRRDGRVAAPTSAFLVLTDGAGRQKRLSMQSRNEDVFAWNLDRVEGSFAYHVEAGSARSETFQLTAVEPVELADDSPPAIVTPPAYVNQRFYPVEKILPGTSSFTAVQYSRVRWQFRFTRPAVQAAVKVVTLPGPSQATPNRQGREWMIPLVHSSDARAASLVLPALAPGRYLLSIHLQAEHAIATNQTLVELTIRPDRAPFFVESPNVASNLAPAQAAGKRPVQMKSSSPAGDDLRLAPGDAVPLALAAGDAEGIGAVEVECSVNGGPPVTRLLFQAKGQRLIKIKKHLDLRGLVKEGDLFFFRVKVSDNRRVSRGVFQDADDHAVPSADLTPQAVYFPAAERGDPRWFVLRVDSRAQPLEQREILAQQTTTDQQLDALKKKIIQAREKLLQLEQSSRFQQDLSDIQTGDLAEMERQNDKLRAELMDLARMLDKVSELQDVGERLREAAQTEIPHSGKALQTARQKRADKLIRQQQMFLADEQLGKALDRLEGARQLNEQLAKARLEILQLQQLARREQELAQKAATLEKLAKDDPQLRQKLDKLRAEQEKVAAELDHLAKNSPAVQQALAQAKAQQAAQLAQQADELVGEQQKVAEEVARLTPKGQEERLMELLREFAAKQQKIAQQSFHLRQKVLKEALARRVTPLQYFHAQAAADSLRQGQINPALGQQALSGRELDRMTDQLEGSLELTGSARDLAQRLAGKQKLLEEELLVEAKKMAGKPAEERNAKLLKIQKGQYAIEQALQGKLRALTPNAGKETHRAATDSAARAVKLLPVDPNQAREQMQKSRQALESLVGLLSSDSEANSAPAPTKVARPAPDQDLAQHVDQLRRLALVQWDLRQQLLDLLRQPPTPPSAEQKRALQKVAQKQESMEKKAADLVQKLDNLKKADGGSSQGKQAAANAAQAGKKAEQAMKQAGQKSNEGNATGAKHAADEATAMLKQAAQQTKEAAQQMSQGKQNSPQSNSMAAQSPSSEKSGSKNTSPKTAQALQEGQKQAAKALGQMSTGQVQGARKALAQAGQSLQHAAQNMGKQLQRSPTQSGPNPGSAPSAAPLTLPDLKKYGPEAEQYSGRDWGQLPGELKTRLLMDARAQYGPEYAAIIQRYFEGIADTRPEK